MPTYEVLIATQINVNITLEADNEDAATDTAWEIADTYSHTLGVQTGDYRITSVEASFDGIGAQEVTRTDKAPEGFEEGCPDCGQDTVVEDEGGTRCSDVSCGWRE